MSKKTIHLVRFTNKKFVDKGFWWAFSKKSNARKLEAFIDANKQDSTCVEVIDIHLQEDEVNYKRLKNSAPDWFIDRKFFYRYGEDQFDV